MFKEEEHPRDEDGKFTFKNGGVSSAKNALENAAQILYGKVYKEEKQEKKYKNILFNVLGKLATPAVILYGKTKDIEKLIKDNGLTNKLKDYIARYLNLDYRKSQINPENGDFGFSESKNNLIYYYILSEDYNKELGDFLHKNTSDPDYYSNDLRHQYVSAIFARNLGEKTAKIFGDLNEINGGLSESGDSDIDQINNEIGRSYAKKYPTMPRQELLKLLLKDHPKNEQIRIEKMKEKNKNNLDREYM